MLDTFVRDRLASALDRIEAEIRKHAQGPVTVVAATKTREAAIINLLPELGVLDYGENRVQEWQEKRRQIDPRLRFHMIGQLQTNKVSAIADHVTLVHSLDRPSLAHALDAQGRKLGRTIPALLEISATGEPNKGGLPWEEAGDAIGRWGELPGLSIRGLMVVAPLDADEQAARMVFRRARAFYDRLASAHEGFMHLSMGMSGDYSIALEEGANMIRLGSALFGPR